MICHHEKNAPGKLVRKNLMVMYPGAAMYGLVFSVMLMMDNIIAGQILGPDGIAAVALGVPGYGVVVALVYALIHGTCLRLSWARGRGDQEGFVRAFSGGLTFIGGVGLLFTLIILTLAEPIVNLCGGDMVDEAMFNSARMYLTYCAPIAFITALAVSLQEILGLIGYQSTRAILSVVNIICNVVISLVCVKVLPEGMKIAGLGIGTSLAGVIQFVASLVFYRMHNIDVQYRPMLFKWHEIAETFKCGVPSSSDYIAETVVMGIQNNLVLMGFPGDTLILATSDVVSNIAYFASGLIKGAAYVAAPLFALFYAGKDKTNLKRTWRESLILGLVMSCVWAVIMWLFLPQISEFCGMEMSQDIQRGVLLSLVFAPCVHIVSLFAMYYESTKRFIFSMVFSIIPDSCLYPIMMSILIPILGKDGIWLSINGNQFIGLIILLPVMYFIIGQRSSKGPERLLMFPEMLSHRVPMLEYEIYNSERTAVDISEKVRTFLIAEAWSPNSANRVALCIEELAVEMHETAVKNTFLGKSDQLLEIMLFDNEDYIEVLIRTLGKPFVPVTLGVHQDDTVLNGAAMVRRIADDVQYTYACRMNTVTFSIRNQLP